MATVYKKFKINAPVNKVWEKIADVGGVHKLFNMLSDAKIEGDQRICKTADGGQLIEKIVSVDHKLKRIVYSITESPFNFEFHSASWQVKPEGDSTSFEWYTDVKPDALAEMLHQVIDGEKENIINGLT